MLEHATVDFIEMSIVQHSVNSKLSHKPTKLCIVLPNQYMYFNAEKKLSFQQIHSVHIVYMIEINKKHTKIIERKQSIHI